MEPRDRPLTICCRNSLTRVPMILLWRGLVEKFVERASLGSRLDRGPILPLAALDGHDHGALVGVAVGVDADGPGNTLEVLDVRERLADAGAVGLAAGANGLEQHSGGVIAERAEA